MCAEISDSGSREMIQMQKDEANAASRQKEAARQGRISSGPARIRQVFEGAPVMKAVNKTGKAVGPAAGTKVGTAVAGLPAGYTYVQVPTGHRQQRQRLASQTAAARGAAQGRQAVSRDDPNRTTGGGGHDRRRWQKFRSDWRRQAGQINSFSQLMRPLALVARSPRSGWAGARRQNLRDRRRCRLLGAGRHRQERRRLAEAFLRRVQAENAQLLHAAGRRNSSARRQGRNQLPPRSRRNPVVDGQHANIADLAKQKDIRTGEVRPRPKRALPI